MSRIRTGDPLVATPPRGAWPAAAPSRRTAGQATLAALAAAAVLVAVRVQLARRRPRRAARRADARSVWLAIGRADGIPGTCGRCRVVGRAESHGPRAGGRRAAALPDVRDPELDRDRRGHHEPEPGDLCRRDRRTTHREDVADRRLRDPQRQPARRLRHDDVTARRRAAGRHGRRRRRPREGRAPRHRRPSRAAMPSRSRPTRPSTT